MWAPLLYILLKFLTEGCNTSVVMIITFDMPDIIYERYITPKCGCPNLSFLHRLCSGIEVRSNGSISLFVLHSACKRFSADLNFGRMEAPHSASVPVSCLRVAIATGFRV